MTARIPFLLTIDRIEPEVLVENRRAHVFFSLTNYSGQDSVGSVHAMLFVGGTQSPPIHSTRWFVQPSNLETTNGVVTIVPPAGKHLRLVLIYDEGSLNNPAVTEEILIDVAARYLVGLRSFRADDLRGGSHDEVFVTLALDTGNPLTSVQRQAHIGNIIRDQQENFPPECTVVDVDIVPGVAPENVVTLSFVMITKDTSGNFGLLKGILDELSDIGQAIASVFVPGDTASIVDQRVHSLHSGLFGGCDGILAADRIVLSGAQIAKWTQSSDQFTKTNLYVGTSKGDLLSGCNQGLSQYQVTWAIKALSIQSSAHTVRPPMTVTR